MRIFLLAAIFLFSSSSISGLGDHDESAEDDDGREVINLGRQTFFQGDVILPASKHRNAILAPARWPNGIIYYTFGSAYPKKYTDMIVKAMRTIESNTCVTFRERVNEPDYFIIVNGTGGCYSQGVGRKGGEQVLSLLHGWKMTCFTHAIVLHELLHVVGLWHEQMRYDRDQHITIHWENVFEDAIGQFRIIPPSQSSVYDLPYDYKSVMHYDAYAFSSGKDKITMEPTDASYAKVIGKAKDASERDWEKIRLVYDCPKLSRSDSTSTPCLDKITTCKYHWKQCENSWIRTYCKKTCNQC